MGQEFKTNSAKGWSRRENGSSLLRLNFFQCVTGDPGSNRKIQKFKGVKLRTGSPAISLHAGITCMKQVEYYLYNDT